MTKSIMRKKYTTFSIMILFFATALILSGCRQETGTPLATTTASPAAEETEALNPAENQYPSTPEEVIRAFVISFPVDKITSVQYLSPSYVKNLDTESVARLLPEEGDITGFIIESGASSAESASSEILTNIAFKDSSAQILFKLEIVDGRWAISQITQTD